MEHGERYHAATGTTHERNKFIDSHVDCFFVVDFEHLIPRPDTGLLCWTTLEWSNDGEYIVYNVDFCANTLKCSRNIIFELF